MQNVSNPGKNLVVEINGKSFARIPIKTHFIGSEDKIDDVIERYVLPFLQPLDMVAFGQKIIAIMQGRVVYKKDLRIGFWTKFLSQLVVKNPAGPAVGDPFKMQVAIDTAGLPRILFASAMSAMAKCFGVSGVFYRIAGNQINQIDGFCDDAFPEYLEIGILGLSNCNPFCDRIKKKFGFSSLVIDINDIGGNILGTSFDLKGKSKLFTSIFKDNPLGQGDQLTPIAIIRPMQQWNNKTL